MENENKFGKIYPAFIKAQSEFGNAKKDAINPHLKNKYATLSAIIDAVRDILAKYDLAFSQNPKNSGNMDYITIETIIMHSSGETIKSEFSLPVLKKDAQGVGSAITYARRYALTSILGLGTEDDDAELATKAAPKIQQKIEKPSDEQVKEAMESRKKWIVKKVENGADAQDILESINLMMKKASEEGRVISNEDIEDLKNFAGNMLKERGFNV
jgi:ERF superfamily